MGKVGVHPIPEGAGLRWEQLVELPFDQSSNNAGSMVTAPIDPTGFDLLICELEIVASYASGQTSSSYYTNILASFMDWGVRINGSDAEKTLSDHVRVCLIKSKGVDATTDFQVLNDTGTHVLIPAKVGITMSTPKGVATAVGVLRIWGGKFSLC